MGESVEAFYGIINNGKTAVIEMASASGLPMVPENKRNPLNTTTYGVGELIKDAIKRGVRDFVIGLGGSATNDGGLGMLSALGVEFKDENNNKCGIFGRDLFNIKSINADNVLKEIKECNFRAACDVTNPLCGSNGASAVFGPQKGADEKMVKDLDMALLVYSDICKDTINKDCANIPGAGAAGGLGYALMAFLNAELEPGIDIVLGLLNIEEEIKTADIVITGEGRLDFQTVMGKAPGGVAKMAKKYSLPVIAFSGSIGKGAEKCNDGGIDAFFPIVRSVVTLEEAMKKENAENNLYNTSLQVFNTIKAFK